MPRITPALAVLALAACARATGARILPPSPPTPLVPYQVDERSLLAPPGGQLKSNSEDVEIHYDGPAVLIVTSVSKTGVSLSESDIERLLHHVPGMADAPLAKEESKEAALFCVENRPRAACARVNDEAGVMVLATFAAPLATYDPYGGARTAAEAARSAKGFRPPEPLPPP
jgi:hypothetical protein